MRAAHRQTGPTLTTPAAPILEPPSQPIVVPEPSIDQARGPPQEPQAIPETIATPADLSAAEDWATPGTQQEIIQQLSVIDPRLLTAERPSAPGQAADGTRNLETVEATPADPVSAQPSLYPPDGIDAEFSLREADAWLANLANHYVDDGAHDTVDTARSPPTSLATDIRTAQGNIFKGCQCPEH